MCFRRMDRNEHVLYRPRAVPTQKFLTAWWIALDQVRGACRSAGYPPRLFGPSAVSGQCSVCPKADMAEGGQHLILSRSLTPGRRTRPCIGRQFGQIVSHKYRFRVRTQPRLMGRCTGCAPRSSSAAAGWRRSCTRVQKYAPGVVLRTHASFVVCKRVRIIRVSQHPAWIIITRPHERALFVSELHPQSEVR